MPILESPQSRCLVGVRRCDITPPVGMYHRMWGAATHDRSTGIHRPLLATALALQSAEAPAGEKPTTQVLVSLDHCLLWTEEMEVLRTSVARATRLELSSLHVTFSHTHAAGLLDPARAELPGGDLIAPYFARMQQTVIDAVVEALESIRPLSMVYGTGRSSLAAHRDLWDAE